MRTTNVKRVLIGVTSTSALSLLLGISPAAAFPPFTFNPNAIPGVAGYPYLPPLVPQADELQGTSNALIQQTGPTTQVETGTLEVTNFDLGGIPLPTVETGQSAELNNGTSIANTYNLYLSYKVTVQGLTGFGANQSSTSVVGDFTLFADVSNNDIFHAASTSATGGTAPSVTDTGTNDIVIAQGTAQGGSTVETNGAGVPDFTVLGSFILCNGTTGSGSLGGTTVAAGSNSTGPGCGTFDALNYFTIPSPFYSFDINSAIGNSPIPASDVFVGPPGNAALNGVSANITFVSEPEPASLAMFGFGLLGLGWFVRRRQKNA